jgi:hypothetical protein
VAAADVITERLRRVNVAINRRRVADAPGAVEETA